jgi:cysteine desulfurase
MTPKPLIYLDHHATTPCDPRVLEAMLPTFREGFGNAASRQHAFGWEAEARVERAREQVAALIGADPVEIVFTSGATESDNLALKGVARASASRGRHIVTTAIEHKAVLDSAAWLEHEGFEVTFVPVTADGLVDVARVAGALRSDTVLVSVMMANNEIGTVQPVGEIGALCKERGVVFHSDAVQALPYLECNVQALGIDLLSISAHKMYGPKGVGALYVRRRGPRVRLEPIIHGGGHERGIRSGTLNVPGIVGLGVACELVGRERDADAKRIGALRDRLREGLLERVDFAIVNGSMEHRLPNNLNLSFPGVNGDGLLAAIKGVAVSSGSACTSASLEPSYVLRALGESEDVAHTSIRFGLGRWTTAAEIETAIEATARAVLAQERAAPPVPAGDRRE